MSKKALIDEIEGKFDTRAAAERAIDSVTAGIAALMKRHEAVSIRDFGTFKVKPRAARTARNPATGEPIQVAAKNVVAFSAKIDV